MKILMLVLLVVVATMGSVADGALNAYMKIDNIAGPVSNKGKEGTIVVFYASHSVSTQSGVAHGRTHGDFLIRKEVDKTSPRLYSTWVRGDTLPRVKIDFYVPATSTTGPSPSEKPSYSVELTSAKITAIKFELPNNKEETTKALPMFESVSFVYQKIDWTWAEGGISASDQWAASLIEVGSNPVDGTIEEERSPIVDQQGWH